MSNHLLSKHENDELSVRLDPVYPHDVRHLALEGAHVRHQRLAQLDKIANVFPDFLTLNCVFFSIFFCQSIFTTYSTHSYTHNLLFVIAIGLT